MIRFPMLLFIASSVLLAAGPPDLLIAIRNGDYAEVQKLLRAGADVNTADSDGTTALMHSVIESRLANDEAADRCRGQCQRQKHA